MKLKTDSTRGENDMSIVDIINDRKGGVLAPSELDRRKKIKEEKLAKKNTKGEIVVKNAEETCHESEAEEEEEEESRQRAQI